MLTSLTIENLKCFAERTEIPLAPITLIYGENSAGKSTILLAIQLLRRYLQEDHNTDMKVPPFGDIVTRGDRAGRTIVLGVETHDEFIDSQRGFNPTADAVGGSLQARIQWSSELQDATLTNLDLQETLDELTEHVPCRWNFTRKDDDMIAAINLLVAGRRGIVSAELLSILQNRRADILDGIDRQIERDLMREFLDTHPEECKRLVENMKPSRLRSYGKWIKNPRFSNKPRANGEFSDSTEHTTETDLADTETDEAYTNRRAKEHAEKAQAEAEAAEWRNGLPAWIGACPPSWRSYRESDSYKNRASELRTTKYRDVIAFCAAPNPDYFAAHPSFLCLSDGDLMSPKYTASRILGNDLPGIRQHILSITMDCEDFKPTVDLYWSSDSADVSRLLQSSEWELTHHYRATANFVVEALRRLVVIAPLRQRAERIYTTALPHAEHMDIDGAMTPVRLARDPDLRKRVNEWLSKLGVDYSIETRDLAGSGYFQLLLLDTRNSDAQPVNYADVGFGISQILPILVACLDKHPSTILIEQPELHIHPRLQAELGSLFEEAMHTFHHQVIVETHSEHLMLRIQKLLRTKTKQLSANSVCVLYVSRGETGSSVQRLEIDANGDFLDAWPKGFFPERLKELL
jgi:predicted ATPase